MTTDKEIAVSYWLKILMAVVFFMAAIWHGSEGVVFNVVTDMILAVVWIIHAHGERIYLMLKNQKLRDEENLKELRELKKALGSERR